MPKETLENERIKAGYHGTARTIERMHELAQKAKLDPTIHRIATWIRLRVPADKRGRSRQLADAIFRWVKKHGIYQRDPFQIERIEHPLASMQPVLEAKKSGAYQGNGLFIADCDTFSIWVAALGGILGYQYAFETAKTDPNRPDDFSHVWPALHVGGKWIAYDASTPQATPGWRPPVSPDKLKRWPEKPIDGMRGIMSGLGHHNGNGAHRNGNGVASRPGLPKLRLTEYQQEVSENVSEDFGGDAYAEYAEDHYWGSNIPKWPGSADQGARPVVPQINGGEFRVEIPPDSATPEGDLVNPSPGLTEKRPAAPSYSRLPMNQLYTSLDYGRPQYRSLPGYYHEAAPTYPGQWWGVQDRPVWGPGPDTLPAAGVSGMGDLGQADMMMLNGGGVTTAETEEKVEEKKEEVDKAANETTSAIDQALQDVIALVPDVGQLYIDKTRAKYQARVEDAKARVAAAEAERLRAEAQAKVAAGIGPDVAKNLLTDPLFLIAVAGGGFALYQLFFKK